MYTDPRVVEFVSNNFLPVRVHAQRNRDEFKELGSRYNAQWTPTVLILDSDNLYARGEVLRQAIDTRQPTFFLLDWWNAIISWAPGDNFPTYQEYQADEGTRYPEVASALQGAPADFVRVDGQNQLVVSVAVPVQRLRATVGAILLSTAPGDIDSVVAQERWSILRIALIAAGVQIVLSLLLAGTIRDGETVHVGADADGLLLGDRARGATQGASATVH